MIDPAAVSHSQGFSYQVNSDSKTYPFLTTLCTSPQDALSQFANRTIDYLHLNGFRDEADVRHTLSQWSEKCSPNAVILLSNIDVRDKGFSVWNIWEGIFQKNPHAMTFYHDKGLGIWSLDSDRDILKLPPELNREFVINYFTDLGKQQTIYVRHQLAARTQALQSQELYDEARDAFVKQQTLESQIKQLNATITKDQLKLKDEESKIHQLEREMAQLKLLREELKAEKQSVVLEKFYAIEQGRRAHNKATQLELENKAALEELLALTKEIDEAKLERSKAAEAAAEEIQRANELARGLQQELENERVGSQKNVHQLRAEADYLREIVASAERWQNRSWFKRAFHKWRVNSRRRPLELVSPQASENKTINQSLPPLNDALLTQSAPDTISLKDEIILLIDSDWYIKTYPASLLSRLAPHEHYLERGVAEKTNPNPYFDTSWYLNTYLDVGQSAANPLVHYCETGWREHRNPSLRFDTAFYLDKYPDVSESGINPLLHFLTDGLREGREPKPLSFTESSDEPFFTSDGRPTAKQESGKGRVLYISGEPKFAGHYYRVENYAKAFLAIGWDVEWLSINDLSFNCEILARSFELLILWRVACSPVVEKVIHTFKHHNKIVVFDVDDLMFDAKLAKTEIIDGIRTQHLTEDEAAAIFSSVRTTLSLSDFGFVPTEELAHQIYLTGRPAFVLPNGFDEGVYRRSAMALDSCEKDRDLVRIGYAGGSKTHQKDFECMAEALGIILGKYRHVWLVLFRNANGPLVDLSEFPELLKLEGQIEWREAVPLTDLPGEMARFDINTAPLQAGNVFCEAKSELKFFEAALLRIPTIASPTEPYRSCIEDGKNGYLALGTDAWVIRLEELIEKRDVRNALGTAAYVTAMAKFGKFARAFRLNAVMDQLLSKGRIAEGFSRYVRLNSQIAKKALPESRPYEVCFESGSRGKSEVSVIITLFNYENYIVDALESVVAQTYSCDLIVIDDKSTDNSLSKVLEWVKIKAPLFTRITVAQHSLNSGLACTRNLGFLLSQTPFAISLDADNQLLPRCAEELLHGIKSGNHAFAYPTIRCIGDYEGPMGNLPYQPQRFTYLNFIDNMAMVSLEAWSIVGGYSKYQEHGWEDYDLWSKLAEVGMGGIWINKTLALYRIHHTSMMRTASRMIERKKSLVSEFKKNHDWARTRETEW